MHDLIVGCRRAKENKHIFGDQKQGTSGLAGGGTNYGLSDGLCGPGRRLQYDAYQCCVRLGRARLFCFCQLARRPLEVESHGAIPFCQAFGLSRLSRISESFTPVIQTVRRPPAPAVSRANQPKCNQAPRTSVRSPSIVNLLSRLTPDS
jgi:hypothetical protein